MAELGALGVADAAEKLPGELSGGMAKRVGIARAMVRSSDVAHPSPAEIRAPWSAELAPGRLAPALQRA
jgi:phospholipid/cholesterol/gamma-HCH transport system ATP-binding protein